MTPAFLFFLRNFNDIDQTAPLLFRLVERGCKIRVVCLSNYDLQGDKRIQALNAHKEFKIILPALVSYFHHDTAGFLRRVFKRAIFGSLLALFVVRTYAVDGCVHTWCDPWHKGFQTKAFSIARRLGIPNICLPHGQNIFVNFNVNGYLTEYHRKHGQWPDFSPRNAFDFYIVQTQHHRDLKVAWGMEPGKVIVLGSMRYSPTWIQQHRDLCLPYEKFLLHGKDTIKIVFFVPHWHYNVDRDSTVELIERIGELKEVVLAVRAHTRGDDLNNEVKKALGRYRNIDLDAQAPSSSLIAWADIVINFGSSIGLEAIVERKFVINPLFLHNNRTVFDGSGAVYDASTIEEVTSLIVEVQEQDFPPLDMTGREALITSEVYGGDVKIDPVAHYESMLCEAR